jgi:hypothetical protein
MELAMLSSRESKKGVSLTPLSTSRLEENNCKKRADLLFTDIGSLLII